MHPWTANLIGLLLGFAIGGAGLVVILPWTQAPAPAAAPEQPSVALAPPAPEASARPAPLPVLRPVELPRIAAPLPQPEGQAQAMPNIIRPEPPPADGHGRHEPGTGVAGTGFFVGSDGTLLTAAHVVSGCRQMRIASRLVRPAAAQLVASDAKQDIALLRAANVTPPAMLPIGRPAAPRGRLFVLGYPASGGPLIPTETWAVLENAVFQPAPAELTDPRRVIWAAAPEVNHGFSGGPMVDPRNGSVVGIVHGMVDSRLLHAGRAAIPASGMVIGPGSSPLTALLRQEGAGDDPIAVSGDEALDAARRATVHVLCLY